MSTEVPDGLQEEINKARMQLREKKPAVYDKLMIFLKKESAGEQKCLYLLDWAFSYECNFSCPHCCAKSFHGSCGNLSFTPEQIRHIADQADGLGVFIINFIGGEPLVWKNLPEIVEALDPARFHLSITTNGWHLTPEMAAQLKRLRIDKVGVSIDSGIAGEHDAFREKPDSFARAVAAVRNAKDAGLRVQISTVATHENIHKEGFHVLLELAKSLDVGLDIQCATVSGGWRGALDVLIDDKDARFLERLRTEHPLLRRDVWPTPGSPGGCPAVKRSLYLIPTGDVLPCLFIHCSLGNVYEQSLSELQDRGLGVRELQEFSGLCLAGEDREFINKYLVQTFDAKRLPVPFAESFGRQIG